MDYVHERLFKILKDKHTQETEETEAAGGYQSTYSKNMYNFEDDSVLREMLTRIINFDCDIESAFFIKRDYLL